MGDPAGIGPEIVAKALSQPIVYEICHPIIIGDSTVMEMGIRVAKLGLRINSIERLEEARFLFGTMDVLDLHNVDVESLVLGKPQAMGGKASVEYVTKAVELAMEGKVQAIVTAPISKEAIRMAGLPYTGHTELLAHLTGVKSVAMMLVTGSLRVVHVTTHVPLSQVPDRIKMQRVLEVMMLTDEAMKALGIQKPRIAVAGLNPHAGEGGLFGREELEEIVPAIEEGRRLGLEVSGPFPPDTIFARAAGGGFDAVIAMYHDQGHIAVKLLGFQWDEKKKGWTRISGVNVTLGLPFVRTSVDHGTAYGKAGRREGTADPGSLLEAIQLAAKLATGRFSEMGRI
ncbi:4-hydroxythreonine-4-phosphate dehydrogenase PdxA [Candidatus Bathyarchaeota archaeon]|nr:4-hydroxythreonine-4-phosphate dehydrogenase PdxA [Candidatus Bathyarchaeota archaeon]MBS7628219.1 4-hydroxythreonine-4-phosphate dehydrogenase PdxA [Candidatus Bathyarchaeota archaeon]